MSGQALNVHMPWLLRTAYLSLDAYPAIEVLFTIAVFTREHLLC